MARPRKQQRRTPSPAPPQEAAAAPEAHSHPPILASAHAIATRVNVRLGSLPHAKGAISAFLDNSHKWTLERATDAGSVHLLERLRGREWSGVSKELREARFLRAIRHAAAKGHLDVLNWWRTTYLPTAWSEETRIAVIRIAAVHGHVHMLEFFLEGERSLQTIIQMGELGQPLICLHPEIVRWIDRRSRRAKLSILLDKAIKEADFDFLDWVNYQRKRHDSTFNNDAVLEAVQAGNLDMTQWIKNHRDDWCFDFAMDSAAKTGQLEIMKWLQATATRYCDFLVPGEKLFATDISMWSSGLSRRVRLCFQMRMCDSVGT